MDLNHNGENHLKTIVRSKNKMKKINIEIELFSYDELEGKAKERALNEHTEFLNSLQEEREDENGNLIKEYRDHEKEEVEDSLRINEYLFYSDGEMIDGVIYTEGHPKAGQMEIMFKGKNYII